MTVIGRLAIAVAATFAGLAERAAGEEGSLEYAVKAAFLHRFGSFVSWPEGSAAPRAPVQICVVGRDPFGPTLDRAVQGQTINGRPIAVRRLSVISPGSGCDIAYLGGSPAQSVAAAARAVLTAPVLTVAEVHEPGVVIQFVLRGNRVRFHIDRRAAEQSRLTVSSKLLNLSVDPGA
ncbi:MAG: YfiR family protein [Phenylobacterium sp.]|uniref:YfiR family protein n=1 Tax=Phenylobacterium sp. TaxID=1871053 RepID=UPI001A3D9094|nr:YfiR family protein [Phenylobacterium sp.]MBL8771025.1 YfiR family protein [Phenylobacterium sp.]